MDSSITVEDAYKKLKQSRAEYREAVIQRMIACGHTTVYEAECYPSSFGRPLPPFRVCNHCGLAMAGWGSGWHMFEKRPAIVPTIKREEGMQLRRGQIYDNYAISDAVNLAGRDNGYNGLEALLRATLRVG